MMVMMMVVMMIIMIDDDDNDGSGNDDLEGVDGCGVDGNGGGDGGGGNSDDDGNDDDIGDDNGNDDGDGDGNGDTLFNVISFDFNFRPCQLLPHRLEMVTFVVKVPPPRILRYLCSPINHPCPKKASPDSTINQKVRISTEV